jgi:hypothetical protein
MGIPKNSPWWNSKIHLMWQFADFAICGPYICWNLRKKKFQVHKKQLDPQIAILAVSGIYLIFYV